MRTLNIIFLIFTMNIINCNNPLNEGIEESEWGRYLPNFAINAKKSTKILSFLVEDLSNSVSEEIREIA